MLIPTLEAPEPRYVSAVCLQTLTLYFCIVFTYKPNRVHAHAAAALINFCEGVERDTLLPYLDPIVERLLKLLNPGASDNNIMPKRYVQEQVITTLAMVADASEATFAKVYLIRITVLSPRLTSFHEYISTTQQLCHCY